MGSGKTIKIKPVSMTTINQIDVSLEEKYRRDGEPIEVPTRDVEVLGGGIEKHQLTADNLRNDDERERWNAHIEALNRLRKDQFTRRGLYLLKEGMEFDFDPNGEWVKRYEEYGLTIPESDIDRLQFYFQNEIARSQAEQAELVQEIMRLSMEGIDQQLLRAVEKSFRDRIGIDEQKDNSSEQNTQ